MSESKCNFILFAHARSGSSAIQESLNLYTPVLREPLRDVQTKEALHRVVNDTFLVGGFKHLVTDLSSDLNFELLSIDCPFVFLYREDVDAVALSIARAVKSSNWLPWNVDLEEYRQNIPVVDYTQWVDEATASRDAIKRYAQSRSCLAITYEQVFTGNLHERASWINKILDYIGCNAVARSSNVSRYLDVSLKLNPDT